MGFVEGEDVERGESGAVQTHVVADGVGFQAVVAHERAITEMEILEVSENGRKWKYCDQNVGCFEGRGHLKDGRMQIEIVLTDQGRKVLLYGFLRKFTRNNRKHAKERTSSLLV